ncbi:MAG: hypothetical protein ABIP78_03590 [Pyrinomonadaceae bacterium]
MNSSVNGENSGVDVTRPKGRLRRTLLNPLFCSVLASFGIFGGISALFIGLICVVVHSLVAADKVFDSVGTILLKAAIPMILIGSVFLDEIPGKK